MQWLAIGKMIFDMIAKKLISYTPLLLDTCQKQQWLKLHSTSNLSLLLVSEACTEKLSGLVFTGSWTINVLFIQNLIWNQHILTIEFVRYVRISNIISYTFDKDQCVWKSIKTCHCDMSFLCVRFHVDLNYFYFTDFASS